jgi:cytochrome b5
MSPIVTSENKVFTAEEVKKVLIFISMKIFKRMIFLQHNTQTDCWIILGESPNKKVYNVTDYLDEHPGGAEVLMEFAGADADEMFEDIGHSHNARETLKKYCIGSLSE